MAITKEQLAARMPLVVSLLICPVLLAVFTLPLSTNRSIYNSPLEWIIPLFVLLLPFAGVLGIVRFARFKVIVKVILSLVYLLVMLPLAIISDIIMGCSWAGGCF